MLFSIKECLKAVQDYLRAGNTFEQLKEQHGIRAKSDGKHVILDYDQITVKWDEPYGYVCRGLVLDAVTFDVLAFGLAKFFNDGEGYGDKIDWATARIVEKLDGTMVNRWYSPHTGKFEYTTRFQLPGDLETNKVGDFNITWKQLLDQAFLNSSFQNVFGDHHTCVYELMSPYNQIVVRHKAAKVVLIAARNHDTMEEEDVYIERLKGMTPQTFDLKNVDELKAFTDSINGADCEGCIVVDANFKRRKWKGSSYVYMHRLKDSAQSVNSLILLAKNGEKEEIIAYFPEFIDLFNKIECSIADFIDRHEKVYNENKDIESQKEFALSIQKANLEANSLLFNVRGKKATSIKNALFSTDENQFLKLIKPLVNFAPVEVSEC